MRMPRWWANAKATSLGYFWLPCPRCGRMFGGHEGRGSMPKPGGSPAEELMTCCPPYEHHPALFGDHSDGEAS